jgi:hypothetical protein
MSLKELVESCDRQEPNNDQTRLLPGKCDASSFGTCSGEMLNIVKRNLAEYFSVVGVTEEFDRTLILMKRILRWRTPFYTKQNVNQHRLRKEEIPLQTLRVIHAYNELDIELYSYSYGRELFRKQVCLQGNSFDLETQIFRKLNATYGRLHLFTSSRIDNLKSRYLSSRPLPTYD